MRVAVVELHVDLTRSRWRGTLSGTLREAIRHDAAREDLVRTALAATTDCTLVVFPGWTFARARPPAWVVAASNDRSIVFECLRDGHSSKCKGGHRKGLQPKGEEGTDYPWYTYVAQKGKLALGPMRQVGAVANDLRTGEPRDRLLTALPRRRFDVAGHDALLLVCGEANIVGGGGGGRRCWLAEDVPADALQHRLVVNPAHTPGGPQAVRDKRAWLSTNGVLISTANTFSGMRGVDAAWTATRVWSRGKVVPLRWKDADDESRVRIAKGEFTSRSFRATPA